MVSGFDSNESKNKKNKKITFAKDKKQVILALISLSIFIVFAFYTKYRMNNLYKADEPKEEIRREMLSPQEEGTEETLPETDLAQEDLAQENLTREELDQENELPQENDLSQEQDPLLAEQRNEDSLLIQQPNLEEQSNNIMDSDEEIAINAMQKPENNQSTPDIEIIPKKQESTNLFQKDKKKTVKITVEDNKSKDNPFLPPKIQSITNTVQENDYSFLLPPPKILPENTEASRIMQTTISGILYDKYNPSAIINIEGVDYLVKRGDVINNYKILAIDTSKVIVQFGKNIYKAGVGQLLSKTNLQYNTVVNLNKRFGGNNVEIKVKRNTRMYE